MGCLVFAIAPCRNNWFLVLIVRLLGRVNRITRWEGLGRGGASKQLGITLGRIVLREGEVLAAE